MNEIIIPKNMQLYWLTNDHAIGGVDKIKYNTLTHKMEPLLTGVIEFKERNYPQ